MVGLVAATLCVPTTTALPPEVPTAPRRVLTYFGEATGYWIKHPGAGGVLASEEYPAAGTLTIVLEYNCNSVSGRLCGQFVFEDALGAAECSWIEGGSDGGSVISVLLGRSGASSCGGDIDGFLVLCNGGAYLSNDAHDLWILGAGFCSISEAF